MQPPLQQHPPVAGRSFRNGVRKPGEAAVEMGKASPAVAASASGSGRGVNSKDNSSGDTAAAGAKGAGAGIFLPPPKSWHSKKPEPVTTSGSSSPVPQAAGQVQQQERGSHEVKQEASLGTPRAAVALPDDGYEASDSSGSAITAAAIRAATPTEPGPAQRAAPAAVDYDALMASAAAGSAGAQPPPELMCSITLDLFKDPVRACDGQAYERDAIEMWFDLGNNQFPDGAPINNTTLTPDDKLKQAVAAWRAAVAGGS
eukprot:GHUV01045951.1.p2 GENE.GHUV01045951.1~~GHUV01045951.1.p2  ORF type:complete len:258 (+),score=123.18 GHUV01045951.1:1450-2223(+)